MNAVDTNIWLYAVDHLEPDKSAKAQDLIAQLAASGETVSPWQVASEFVNGLRRWERKRGITTAKVDEWTEWMIEAFPIVTPQHTTVLTALDLSRRYCLSHWDSMLLAACLEAGVTTLYSEDLSHGQRYDTVLVVNPFVAATAK